MSEHLSAQSLEQYRRRALSPADLLRADDHLATCEQCRARAGESFRPEQLLGALHADLEAGGADAGLDHLSYQQIAALVDGELDIADREIAGSHLEGCQICADEVEDLRAFRISLADTSTEQVTQNARATVPLTFRERLDAFRRLFALPVPIPLAVGLVLLLVSLIAVLFWKQSRPMPEVVQTTSPTNSDTPRPSPGVSPERPPAGSENASTEIVVAIDDGGGRVTIDAQGTLKGLEALSPGGQQAVKRALTNGRVEKAEALSGLNGRAGTLMGGSPDAEAKFSLLSPVGIVVRSDRPQLSWRPLPGASEYTVTVLDSDLKQIASSPPLSTTKWTLPRALERGRIYQWQVSARKDEQQIIAPAASAPEARFRILDKSKDDELRQLERINAGSHLARGVLYAQVGLLDEAERELRALVTANPKSEVARKLLRSVREARSK